jgi:hypothetical protein
MRTLILAIAIGVVSLVANAKEGPKVGASRELKMVSYRGGLVFFALPATWREEYQPDGGGTFHDDRPGSGTLRLNVLSFSSKGVPAQQMAATAFPKGSFELLQDGFPLRKTVAAAEEKGRKLRLHSWEIAVPVTPNSLRIVAFRHTVLAEQEKDQQIVQELEFIDRSVRAATFSQEPGIAGSYIQR